MRNLDEIDLLVGVIHEVNEEGGPAEEHRPLLAGVFAEAAARLAREPSTRARLDEALATLPPFCSADSILGISWQKPHGYAGDFEVIDRMHTLRCSPDALLGAWDRFAHEQPGPRAVRARARYLHQVLREESERRGGTLQVLDLASGPCRDVADFLGSHPDADVRFTCLDLDPKAIAHAREVVGGEERVRFVHGDARKLEADQRFDLVWSAGLFDYFADSLFVRVLERLWAATAPGGLVVVGNFCASEPTRPLMDVLDWPLHRRSAPRLRRLAEAAGVPSERIRVDVEPNGVNLLLRCRR